LPPPEPAEVPPVGPVPLPPTPRFPEPPAGEIPLPPIQLSVASPSWFVVEQAKNTNTVGIMEAKRGVRRIAVHAPTPDFDHFVCPLIEGPRGTVMAAARLRHTLWSGKRSPRK